MVAKAEGHDGNLFPMFGFIVTNSQIRAGKVVKEYNGYCDVANKTSEGNNTLRWDKLNFHHIAAD